MQPFRTLAIKWEVYIIVKEAFLCRLLLRLCPSCVVIIVSLWIILHIYVHVCRCESAYDYITAGHVEIQRNKKHQECHIVIYSIYNDTIIKTDTMIKTQEDFFNKIYTSHFICKVRKGLLKVCVWERAGDRTETAIFWPSLLWPSHCVFLVLLMLNRRSRGPLCWVMASFTASYQHLLWTSIHLGSRGPLRPGVALPTTTRLTPSPTLLRLAVELQLSWLLSWPSYIIVQRLLDRPLNLWNRMFNRHQAGITVMQFRGHSLPVRQSMRVSWDFFLPRPISSANFHPRDFLS